VNDFLFGKVHSPFNRLFFINVIM